MANDYMAKLAAELEGNRMDDLASMGRFGDTMVAHINPQEAQMLIDKGGAGTINPMTGLPEFYFDDPGYSTDADMSGAEGDTSDTSGIGEYDDSDAGQAGPMPDTPALSPATVDEIADFYGFGSPTEGVAGAQEGFKGFGDPDLGGFYSSGTATQLLKERLNKPGGMTKAEQLLYTQLLNTGLIGSEAMAKMAELLATPGVAAAVESGYSEGYQYGGILGDALAAQEDALGAMSAQIKATRKKQDEEAEKAEKEFFDDFTFEEPKQDMFDKFLGGVKDYFTGPSEKDTLALDMAVRGAGYGFTPTSDAEKYAGTGLGYLAPGPIGFAKGLYDVGAFLTDSRIVGNVDTPYGTFALTESGDLTAPDMFVGADNFGNEPTITKKRKEATKPKEEEEKEEEEDKPYFPEISTATLTPSEIQTITNIYGPDSYLLNQNQTGLRTLV
jgi:hypothetical protein